MPHQTCPCCHGQFARCSPAKNSRGIVGSLISFAFQAALIYVGLLFTGGTLIKTGHPVAVEAGRLIHTVTLVEPAMRWTQSQGFGVATFGLQTIAGGMRFS